MNKANGEPGIMERNFGSEHRARQHNPQEQLQKIADIALTGFESLRNTGTTLLHRKKGRDRQVTRSSDGIERLHDDRLSEVVITCAARPDASLPYPSRVEQGRRKKAMIEFYRNAMESRAEHPRQEMPFTAGHTEIPQKAGAEGGIIPPDMQNFSGVITDLARQIVKEDYDQDPAIRDRAIESAISRVRADIAFDEFTDRRIAGD